VFFTLLVATIPISLADLKYSKIPNIYLLYLSLFSAPFVIINGLGSIPKLLTSLLVVLLLHLCGMGMGDAKLLLIILITHNSDHQFSSLNFFTFLLLIATMHVLLLGLMDQSVPRKIPLAPSIFAGLALYMATR
jgi:Flp pilus assembly protein protease CpaA